MIDVAFAPNDVAAADVAGRAVIVIDVLRATTTICTALAHGAKAVIPVADTEAALRLQHALERNDVILAGERYLDPIPGFQAGNSPREMTRDRVAGKTLVLKTTNGTGALLATHGAREVIVAAAVNLSAAGTRARALLEEHGRLLILCAGRETGFGLDDAYIAGRLVRAALGGRRTRKGLNDSAIAAVDLVRSYGDRVGRVLALSRAGQELRSRGLGEDVVFAGQVDLHGDQVPVFQDHRVVLSRHGRGLS
ncbi:MAG TPA: 2-phosphosulfolactate phosphatase [Gemmatimonadales bacterium]|nr:2-phosphosulfolactate phosphatase [Gemmatimonadales bacterium]